MSRGWHVRFQWQTLLLCLAVSRVAFGGWEFTPPGDPNRNWNINLTSGGAYDDNSSTSQKHSAGTYQIYSDVALQAKVPLERCLVGVNYDYRVSYPRDVHSRDVNENHNLSVSANYIPTPRLTLGIAENYVSTLEPGVVQTQAGVPVTVVQSGNYTYDSVGGNLNYALTPRWNLAISGSWDIWRYEDSLNAQANDREDYQTTLSALYGFNQRTTVGLNYQYSQNVFVDPGPSNGRNGQSHTVYLSAVWRCNPRLSLQLNSGYTVRESGDGSRNAAPTEFGSLVYNYGPNNAVSLTLAHTLSEAVTTGNFRQFSASENTSVALHVDHRLTARLRTLADFTYVFSTFESPLPGQTGALSAQEQQLAAHLGSIYAFRDWVSAVFDYEYSMNRTDVAGFSFDRNRYSLGIRVTY